MAYFKKWHTMISLEEGDALAPKKETFSVPSTQREKLGNCAARMLARHVTYGGGGAAGGSAGGARLGVAEAVVTLERFDTDEAFAAIFGWQRGVLTDLALAEGDAVLVRGEDSRYAGVIREGVVEEVTLRYARVPPAIPRPALHHLTSDLQNSPVSAKEPCICKTALEM